MPVLQEHLLQIKVKQEIATLVHWENFRPHLRQQFAPNVHLGIMPTIKVHLYVHLAKMELGAMKQAKNLDVKIYVLQVRDGTAEAQPLHADFAKEDL